MDTKSIGTWSSSRNRISGKKVNRMALKWGPVFHIASTSRWFPTAVASGVEQVICWVWSGALIQLLMCVHFQRTQEQRRYWPCKMHSDTAFLGLFCTVVTNTVSVHQPLYGKAPYTVIFSEDLIIEMLLSSISFLQLLYQGTPNKWRKKTNFILTCLESSVMVMVGLFSFCEHSSRLFSFH